MLSLKMDPLQQSRRGLQLLRSLSTFQRQRHQQVTAAQMITKVQTPALYHDEKIVRPLAWSSRDPFIVATDKDSIKPDGYSRRFIRHHVMKGKNRDRSLSRASTPKSWINQANGLAHSQTRVCPQMTMSPMLVGFEACIDSHMLQDAFRFINIMQQAMYPIENCIDTREDSRHWFEDLVHDPDYAQSVCISARAYFEIVDGQILKTTAIAQMNRGIAMLRRKLSNINMLVIDSIIFLILAVAMISELFQEFDAAEKHLSGLYELVNLQGGLSAFSRKHLLQVKCCRFDLRFALRRGVKPLFFSNNDFSWEPYLCKSKRLPITAPLNALFLKIDKRMMNVWLDLRELTTALDLAHQTRRLLSSKLFQETLLSVLYRLGGLAFDAHDRNEILRKTLLVFASTTFLYTGSISVPNQDLMTELTQYLISFCPRGDRMSLELSLWIAFVLGPGLDNSHDRTWLYRIILRTSRALNLHSWSGIRKLLKNFLWVDVLKNETGENIFNEAWRYNYT